MAALAPKGMLGIVGIPPPGATLPGELGTVLTFGQTVRGIIEGDSDPDVFLPQLIAHWRAGRLPLEKLVRTFPFAEINEAIEAQHHGDCVKVVLTVDRNPFLFLAPTHPVEAHGRVQQKTTASRAEA